jgi:hypothetical protein
MPFNATSLINSGLAELVVSFRPDTTNPPLEQRQGDGYSVAFISTGLWRISFNTPLPGGFVCALPGMQLTAFADSDVQLGPFVVGSPSTLDVRVNTAGALANIAAAADNRISVLVFVRIS